MCVVFVEIFISCVKSEIELRMCMCVFVFERA